MSNALVTLEQHLQQQLGAVVVGMESVVRGLTIAIVARGHVLLQGAPGLGKTLLSKTLAAALGGRFQRVQGTADLMPADIIGMHVFDSEKREFVFRPGPVFADVLLVDEVNRAGPKTQSALLEAMEERLVSIDRKHYRLPEGFIVVATQNPREFEGTYPLPESQIDRFMLRIDLSYPSREHELSVLERYGQADAHASASGAIPVASDAIAAARVAASQVHVAPELLGYVLDVCKASREHPHISLGISTRGALALIRATRIHAGLNDAQFATPDDVKAVASWVIAHRLVLSPEATLEGITELQTTQRLLEQTPVPK